MAVFTNTSKSSAPSFSAASKHSTAFSNVAKTLRTFGSFTFDEIGAMTFNGMINGKLVGDYTFDDLIGTVFVNTVKD